MISYAQNFEDVMLARAFSGQSSGFYIDIGVWHPTVDSVTKHFYDQGWNGINVEPIPERFSTIAEARTNDVNIHAAISSAPGPLEIHQVAGTGLSTVRSDYAKRHLDAGFEVRTLQVPTLSLRALCVEHVLGRSIDFMKIDVEGAEAEVINSGDWNAFRPRIVLVEAVEPNSTVEAHSGWEPMLIDANYTFAYFDGLNRWYYRNDEPELKRAFHAPPNAFDQFELARTVEIERRLGLAEGRIQSAMKKADRLDQIGSKLLGKLLLRIL